MITDKLWYQMWEFDRKNPHDRYKLYCKEYEEKDLNKLLQFLYYINRFFGEKLDLNCVYLVEDAKFIELMEYFGIKFGGYANIFSEFPFKAVDKSHKNGNMDINETIIKIICVNILFVHFIFCTSLFQKQKYL